MVAYSRSWHALIGALVLGACQAPATPSPEQVREQVQEQERIPLVERDRPPAPAPTDTGPRSNLALQLGAGHWPGLGDLDPDGSLLPTDILGPFEDWGFSLALSFGTPVAEFGGAQLDVGFDLGVMSFDNERDFDLAVVSPEVYEDGFAADLVHIAPSARMLVPLDESFRAFYGLGLGYYHLTLRDRAPYYRDSLTDEGAFGGFLAFGFDYLFGDGDVGLRIENKMHHAAFDRLRGFAGELDGFIYTVELGVVFAF